MGPPGPNDRVFSGIARLTYCGICTTRAAFSRGEDGHFICQMYIPNVRYWHKAGIA